MRETESLYSKNIGLKDIPQSRRAELNYRGECTTGIIYACTKFLEGKSLRQKKCGRTHIVYILLK